MERRKRALIVEGGGLRGAYAVGVLRVLHANGGPEQFDVLIAESSAVFAATFFAAGQVEEMENTWRNLVHGRQLIDYQNMFRALPILGLDYLIDLFRGPVRLDLDKVMKSFPELWYVLTDHRSGDPVYVNAKCPEILDLMRASAALPFLYPLPVIIGERTYYDGGHSDAIPVHWAIERGYDDILAVLTQPKGYKKGRWSAVLARLFLSGPPRARRALSKLHEVYNESLRVIEAPPSGIKIDVIRPRTPLINRFTRDQDSIISAIELGKADASEYLSPVGPPIGPR